MPKTPEERAAFAAYMREWRRVNADKEKAIRDRANAVEREKGYPSLTKYRENNREEINTRARARRADDPEPARLAERKYRAENLEQRRAVDRINASIKRLEDPGANTRWLQANPDKMREYNDRNRARRANAPIIDLSDDQWQEIQEAFDHRCAYCGKRCKGKLTKDHVTPYTKQGSHTVWNVVPACQSCNSKKGTRPPLKPVQPLLLTIAPKKPKKRG